MSIWLALMDSPEHTQSLAAGGTPEHQVDTEISAEFSDRIADIQRVDLRTRTPCKAIEKPKGKQAVALRSVASTRLWP